MEINLFSILTLIIAFTFSSCQNKKNAAERTIPIKVLKDKIAGGWAGKMIGGRKLNRQRVTVLFMLT